MLDAPPLEDELPIVLLVLVELAEDKLDPLEFVGENEIKLTIKAKSKIPVKV
jgi:hypothetical protein